MSLSWRERLVATLTPGGVQVRRMPPFWRRERREDQRLDCPSDEGGEPWRAPLSRLAPLLKKNTELEVVLSSHFVRLQLLPWQAELRTREEMQAYAGFRFHEIYGALADAWDIVWSAEPPGQASVACAVDRTLLTALRELARERACRLVSVQPAFALAWNRHREALRGPAGAFVLAEPGRLCAGLCRGGEWFALRNQVVGEEGFSAALPALLEQQMLLADAAVAGGEVLVAGLDGAPLGDISGLPAGWSLCRIAAATGRKS